MERHVTELNIVHRADFQDVERRAGEVLSNAWGDFERELYKERTHSVTPPSGRSTAQRDRPSRVPADRQLYSSAQVQASQWANFQPQLRVCGQQLLAPADDHIQIVPRSPPAGSAATAAATSLSRADNLQIPTDPDGMIVFGSAILLGERPPGLVLEDDAEMFASEGEYEEVFAVQHDEWEAHVPGMRPAPQGPSYNSESEEECDSGGRPVHDGAAETACFGHDNDNSPGGGDDGGCGGGSGGFGWGGLDGGEGGSGGDCSGGSDDGDGESRKRASTDSRLPAEQQQQQQQQQQHQQPDQQCQDCQHQEEQQQHICCPMPGWEEEDPETSLLLMQAALLLAADPYADLQIHTAVQSYSNASVSDERWLGSAGSELPMGPTLSAAHLPPVSMGLGGPATPGLHEPTWCTMNIVCQDPMLTQDTFLNDTADAATVQMSHTQKADAHPHEKPRTYVSGHDGSSAGFYREQVVASVQDTEQRERGGQFAETAATALIHSMLKREISPISESEGWLVQPGSSNRSADSTGRHQQEGVGRFRSNSSSSSSDGNDTTGSDVFGDGTGRGCDDLGWGVKSQDDVKDKDRSRESSGKQGKLLQSVLLQQQQQKKKVNRRASASLLQERAPLLVSSGVEQEWAASSALPLPVLGENAFGWPQQWGDEKPNKGSSSDDSGVFPTPQPLVPVKLKPTQQQLPNSLHHQHPLPHLQCTSSLSDWELSLENHPPGLPKQSHANQDNVKADAIKTASGQHGCGTSTTVPPGLASHPSHTQLPPFGIHDEVWHIMHGTRRDSDTTIPLSELKSNMPPHPPSQIPSTHAGLHAAAPHLSALHLHLRPLITAAAVMFPPTASGDVHFLQAPSQQAPPTSWNASSQFPRASGIPPPLTTQLSHSTITVTTITTAAPTLHSPAAVISMTSPRMQRIPKRNPAIGLSFSIAAVADSAARAANVPLPLSQSTQTTPRSHRGIPPPPQEVYPDRAPKVSPHKSESGSPMITKSLKSHHTQLSAHHNSPVVDPHLAALQHRSRWGGSGVQQRASEPGHYALPRVSDSTVPNANMAPLHKAGKSSLGSAAIADGGYQSSFKVGSMSPRAAVFTPRTTRPSNLASTPSVMAASSPAPIPSNPSSSKPQSISAKGVTARALFQPLNNSPHLGKLNGHSPMLPNLSAHVTHMSARYAPTFSPTVQQQQQQSHVTPAHPAFSHEEQFPNHNIRVAGPDPVYSTFHADFRADTPVPHAHPQLQPHIHTRMPQVRRSVSMSDATASAALLQLGELRGFGEHSSPPRSSESLSLLAGASPSLHGTAHAAAKFSRLTQIPRLQLPQRVDFGNGGTITVSETFGNSGVVEYGLVGPRVSEPAGGVGSSSRLPDIKNQQLSARARPWASGSNIVYQQ